MDTFTDSSTVRSTSSAWGPPVTFEADQLGVAARAARIIGRHGRSALDVTVKAVAAISTVVAACGLVPLFGVTASCVWWLRRRSQRLDLVPWTAATPNLGATAYRAVEVAAPLGLDVGNRHYRWWSVVDTAGSSTLGLFGVSRWNARPFIVPGTPPAWGTYEPTDIAPWWTTNSTLFPKTGGSYTDKAFTVLHFTRETVEPVIIVRLVDHSRRRPLEALVHAPDKVEDVAVAVLSCMAIYRRRVRPGRRPSDLPAPITLVNDL